MAPESERATCPHCGRPDYHYHATNCPNAESLTCSEVVERLQFEALCTNWTKQSGIDGFRAQAELILHSWRERRVQELEEALRNVLPFCIHDGSRAELCDSCKKVSKAESLLAKSDEWPEQIRKGAKHE